jgi:hypothetical protein
LRIRRSLDPASVASNEPGVGEALMIEPPQYIRLITCGNLV